MRDHRCSGKFVEAALKALYVRAGKDFTGRAREFKAGKVMTELEQLPAGSLDDSVRLTIPRGDYAKSPLFSEAEKIALEYADAITDTRRDVDDGLFARMQQHYDDDTIIAELTTIIAWENASSRFKPGVLRPIARILETMTADPLTGRSLGPRL